MNVVVIVIDALRASDVSYMGRSEEITPNIDSLAERSLVFENCFSMSNYTDACMSSIFSGKAPREHGVTHHGTAYTKDNLSRINERNTDFLPEILSESGYETLGVDWMGRWHSWGYDTYGIDDQDAESDEEAIGEVLRQKLKRRVKELPEPLLRPLLSQYYNRFGRRDLRVDCEEVTDIAIRRLDSVQEPFFLMCHYWDVHPPYIPPEEHEAMFNHEDGDHLSKYFGPDAKGPLSAEYQMYARKEHETMGDAKEAYDGTVRWVDQQIGRLIDYLERNELMEDTMIVLTADHGHNFGEHGIFSDNSGLYDTSIHVPLVVHHPENPAERVNGIVQHIDIVPTVLDYAGLEIPDDLRGNVLPAVHEFAFAETIEQTMAMIRTEDWKLIQTRKREQLESEYWYQEDGEFELYNLNNDPSERRNVADQNPSTVRYFRKQLERELERQTNTVEAESSKSVEIDEDELDGIQERLEALGYAERDNT
jgi:arylsulfatase A-like enzyme